MPASHCVICSLGCSFCGVLAGMTFLAHQCCFVTIIFSSGCRSDAVVDTLFVVCRVVNLFNFRYFEQTFISAIAHAMLSNFLSSFVLRLILICDFRRICSYLSGDICTTYTICFVLLRFSRTHLSRSEVLTCLHLSHCFAKVRGWRRKRCFNLILKATICVLPDALYAPNCVCNDSLNTPKQNSCA